MSARPGPHARREEAASIAFGPWLATLRKRRGMTQEELADRIDFGHANSVGYWEVGQNLPSFQALIKLAEVLDVSVDTLMLGERA